MIELVVYGIPAPQGSKTRTQWGMRDDNPNTKPWRAAVAAEAALVSHGLGLLEGPLKVRAEFFFPRPKSHFGSGRNAEIPKPNAPDFHTSKPDGDKLARAIGDALTGIVFRDDSQVAVWRIVKRYGHPARVELEIGEAA